MKTIWPGYLSPEWRDCPANCNAGYSAAYEFLREPMQQLMWKGRPSQRPAEVHTITAFLAGRRGDRSPFGHDSSDLYSAIKKLGELAGIKGDWTSCHACKGSGIHPDDYEASEAWTRTEPPTGEGWQMWETVSEGSPISPVFETPEKLARWLADTRASAMGGSGATYEQWLAMIRQGSAVSMIMEGGVLRSGVEAAGDSRG